MTATQTVLVLKGNLALGGTNIATASDVSINATAFRLSFDTDIVEVPPTLSKGKRNQAGNVQWSIEIGYLSNDIATSLFRILYAAAVSATGELFFVGSMQDGAVAVTNPRYCGTLIVNAADLGGDAASLSVGSGTFKLKGAPTKEVA